MKNKKGLVETLRNNGFKVRISHYRRTLDGEYVLFSRTNNHGQNGENISQFGGQTVVTVTHESNSQNHGVGESFCSAEDNFNYKVGTMVAIKRAIKKLKECPYVGDLEALNNK